MRRATTRPCGLALGVAVLLLLGPGCGPKRDAAVERILEKNAAARGGLAAWRNVKTLSMTGALEAGPARDPVKRSLELLRRPVRSKSEERRAVLEAEKPLAPKQVRLPFVMELKRPRQSRLEVRFRGDTAVQVYDGSAGWKLRPFLGRRDVEAYTPAELGLAARQADLDGPLLDARAKGSDVKLVTTEKIEGKDAYKLEVRAKDGQVRTVWVDTTSFLDVRVDGTRIMDGKARPVFTTFRDWRAEGGLMMPHTLETTVQGLGGSEKIVIERVLVNPALASARFERPAT